MKKTLAIKNQHEYRCPVCRRLLLRGKIVYIETKCPKCGNVVTLRD